MLRDYGVLGIILLCGFAYALVVIVSNWLVRPKKPSREKEKTYECGLDTQGTAWVQFRINYFLYALIFVVFDVETVFLYPWAVAFKAAGLFAFVEMLIFMGILVLGLWYAWKEGALEWK